MNYSDLPEDILELEELAKGGNPKAMLHCAFYYEGQFDYEKANKYYKIGAESGFADAQFFYAFRLENGINTDKNIFEANKYYKLSADQGNKDAQFHYSLNLQEGAGVPQDEDKAKMYMEMAKSKDIRVNQELPDDLESLLELSEKGNSHAMLMAAFNYEKSNNNEKSCEYFKKSADSGNSYAQFLFSLKLENGIGVPIDLGEANRYLMMSIENGNQEAKDYFELRKPKEQQETNQLPPEYSQLKKQADKGDTQAQLRLGIMLDNCGNYEEANKMFKLSADNGNSNAQFLYGLRLELGVNITPNVAIANLYYRKSALQGNEDAQFRFATNLEKGNGVKVNVKEANRFYQMSAKQGHKDSMIALSKNLKTGNGIEKNEKLADELMKKAFSS